MSEIEHDSSLTMAIAPEDVQGKDLLQVRTTVYKYETAGRCGLFRLIEYRSS